MYKGHLRCHAVCTEVIHSLPHGYSSSRVIEGEDSRVNIPFYQNTNSICNIINYETKTMKRVKFGIHYLKTGKISIYFGFKTKLDEQTYGDLYINTPVNQVTQTVDLTNYPHIAHSWKTRIILENQLKLHMLP